MSNNCDQCNKPAFYIIEGHPLCISCYHLLQQSNLIRNNIINEQINNQLAHMEMISGLPGSLPRRKITQPNIFAGDFNNIKIDSSIVGAVNTGTVDNLEVSMNHINNKGNKELVTLIKIFTEMILTSDQINKQSKEEVIEQVSYIAEEVLKPKELQKPSVIKSTLNTIKDSVATINGISSLWDTIHKHIHNLI